MEKCLHILPMNKISGAEKMALLICKNLRKYEPVVLCGGKTLKKVFCDNDIMAYDTEFSIKYTLLSLKKIKSIIDEQHIKIVHAHDNRASLLSYLVKNLYKRDIKIVSHIHNCYPWLKDNGLNRLIDKLTRNKYDYNITCGSTVYQYYKNNGQYIKEEKVISLSNAMDIEEIESFILKDEEELRKKFNLDKDKKILGYIGRLDDQKGVIEFIKALAPHRNRFKDSKIIMVGNGEYEERVKNLIEELNLQGLITLAGFQDNIYKFYPLMDLFFLPSKYEGLPMVLLEAMAFKKPIVSMNVGSIEEIIGEERGKLIEPSHYDDFVQGLWKVKDSEELRKKYGESGYRYLKENYGINKYIDEIEEVYERVEGGDSEENGAKVNGVYSNL